MTTTKIDPRDIDWEAARSHTQRLLRIIEGASYVAPELMAHPLQDAAQQMNRIAAALKLTGGPKGDTE